MNQNKDSIANGEKTESKTAATPKTKQAATGLFAILAIAATVAGLLKSKIKETAGMPLKRLGATTAIGALYGLLFAGLILAPIYPTHSAIAQGIIRSNLPSNGDLHANLVNCSPDQCLIFCIFCTSSDCPVGQDPNTIYYNVNQEPFKPASVDGIEFPAAVPSGCGDFFLNLDPTGVYNWISIYGAECRKWIRLKEGGEHQ